MLKDWILKFDFNDESWLGLQRTAFSTDAIVVNNLRMSLCSECAERAVPDDK